MLRVLGDDLEGFRASCGTFFKKFGNGDDKSNLYRASMAGPDPLPIDDLKRLIAAAEKDLERHPKGDSYIMGYYGGRGALFAAMIHERAGNHARALGILDQTPPGHSEAIPLGAMRAIVLHHLGRDDEARNALTEVDGDLSNVFRDQLKGDSPQPISDPETIIYRELMRREARSLIDGKSSPQDPYRMLGRARVLAKMGREKDAEQILVAAVAAGANAPKVMAAFTRVLSQIGRGQESQSASTRALALFEKALTSKPDNVELLRTRGEIFAAQGEWDKAAIDLARVFSAGKEIKPRWFLAGTWIVGPYPFDGANPESSRAASLPPENSPDPFRPVAGPDGKTMLTWRSVTTDANGFMDLGPLIQPKDRIFTYVLTRVYSPENRTIVVVVSNNDWLRLWCNGDELREHSLLSEVSVPLTVPLRAGWNTLLAKVSNKESAHSFKLKLTDEAGEIAQVFGQYIDKQGWNDQSAAILDRLYTYLPHGVGAWEPRSFLDAEVVSREALFQEALTRRPKDHQLWVARGRYLAWQERWDEALLSYDKAIKGSPTLEDAHFEYACILLLKGDPAAYHKWCERLGEKFPPSEGHFENLVRARTGAMTAQTPDDASRLVGWAEKAITKDSRAWDLHVLAMAMLRAGRTEDAARIFQDSIKADRKWLPVLNELGVALAHHQLNHAAEARRWLDQAQDDVKQYDDHIRDRANRRLPPSALTDWLEIQLLLREALSLVGKNRLADLALSDQAVVAGQLLRLPLGPVSLARDLDTVAMPGLFRLVAPFRTKTPVADGMIGPDEYGPPLAIDFTDDVNPGRLSLDPPNPPRNADDLSAELFLAHTRTDLFIAVRVRDDVLIAQKNHLPSQNDRVELYIDGDRMPGDCKNSEIPGSYEGFQICAGFDGRKEYWGVGISDAAYTVGTSTFPGGYIVEFRVPLTMIDTVDGPEVKAASSGSTLRFNLSILDNDEPVADQPRRGELWHIGIGIAQMAWWVGDGPGWPVDLHLARPVKYELVDGPKGATIDPESGLFVWQTPKEPQTAKITVRVRDADKPDLTDEASFLVISTTPRN
jgi:tetratricopeptide (TPR) repeat protein